MGRLDGKVAIVTGGAGGIGRACSAALAREGAAVVVADLAGVGAEDVAKEIAGGGGRAMAVAADVSEEADTRNMVAQAVEAYGRLDVLVNNAAATSLELVMADSDVVAMDVDVWDRTMAVNLRGAMLGCKYAVPAMVAGGGGSIVNMSSGESLLGDFRMCAYGASKAGLNNLTRHVATAYGKEGVRCNAIAPGLIRTPKVAEVLPPFLVDVYLQNHLTPRLGEPDDVAHLVVYLASDEAAFLTGAVIPLDGGFSAHQPSYAQMRSL
jgi:NAD(P)-dependent dehydrogenase (short-subunit alcohol dehydrogenase family)